MEKVIMLALLTAYVFAGESGNIQRNQETQNFMHQSKHKKEVLKKDANFTQTKVMEKKQYPMKMKEYPRGTIATH